MGLASLPDELTACTTKPLNSVKHPTSSTAVIYNGGRNYCQANTETYIYIEPACMHNFYVHRYVEPGSYAPLTRLGMEEEPLALSPDSPSYRK